MRKQHRSFVLRLIAASVPVLTALASPRAAQPERDAAAPAPPRPLTHFLPDRNRVNREARNLPDSWDVEKGTNIKWSADLGSKAHGGPVIAGGKVFVGTNNDGMRDPRIIGDKGVLMCFEEKTGKFLWQITHDKLLAGQVQDWPKEGVASSPAVDGDRLYYVSNRCEVVCADVNGDPKNPGKGKVLWTYDMIGKQNVFPHNLALCSPLIVNDMLFVVTANGVDERHINLPAPEAPSFLCLKKTGGEFVWKSNLPSAALVEARKKGGKVDVRALVNKGKLVAHGQWSNPVYAEPMGKPMVIFPGGDGWLYAFEPKTGTLLWKFDCNPKTAVFGPGLNGTRNDFIATPVVWENKLYIGVGQDPEHRTGVGRLWCIDITRTPQNPEKDLSPVDDIFDAKHSKNKDSALVWHYGGVAPRDSKIKRPYLFGRTLSTCAVHDGLVCAADLNGWVYCFNANTGEKYWDHHTKSQIWSSPYWADGKVYIGNDDGEMFVFKHGKKKQKFEQIEMGGILRMWHAAAGDTLFVITQNDTKLLAIAKR